MKPLFEASTEPEIPVENSENIPDAMDVHTEPLDVSPEANLSTAENIETFCYHCRQPYRDQNL